MDLKITRQIIDCIHDGSLEKIPTKTSEVFGFHIPEHCPGVADNILFPKKSWNDAAGYDETLKQLAQGFIDNFKVYEDKASKAITNAGPKL